MSKVLIEELPNGALGTGKLYFTDDTPIVRTKQTQADRIRSMSDEELAEFLTFNGFCNASPLCPHRNDNIQCEQCVIEWLKSEVKE